MMKPTVLIVESDMAAALEAEILLLDSGFLPVGHACDSQEARALGARLRPDVALVDVELRDGATGASLARSFKAELDTVVVFAAGSAVPLPPDLAGAVGVIAKPFAAPRFHEAMSYVQDVLDGEAGEPPASMLAMPHRNEAGETDWLAAS